MLTFGQLLTRKNYFNKNLPLCIGPGIEHEVVDSGIQNASGFEEDGNVDFDSEMMEESKDEEKNEEIEPEKSKGNDQDTTKEPPIKKRFTASMSAGAEVKAFVKESRLNRQKEDSSRNQFFESGNLAEEERFNAENARKKLYECQLQFEKEKLDFSRVMWEMEIFEADEKAEQARLKRQMLEIELEQMQKKPLNLSKFDPLF